MRHNLSWFKTRVSPKFKLSLPSNRISDRSAMTKSESFPTSWTSVKFRVGIFPKSMRLENKKLSDLTGRVALIKVSTVYFKFLISGCVCVALSTVLIKGIRIFSQI